MISGPVTPRSGVGVWELVRQHTQLLERGLRLLQEDLEFGGGASSGCVVDAIACDALGAPVLLFVVDGESRDLAGRIVVAESWFRRHGDALQRVLKGHTFKTGAVPRLLVVGLAIPAELVEALERIACERLEVVQVSAFWLRGEAHYDVEVLAPRGERRLACEGPPQAIVDARARELAACLMDLVQRIDPRVVTSGDRFTRRFALAGELLCELCFDERGLVLHVDGVAAPLHDWDDVIDAVDRVLRHWHLGFDEALSEAVPSAGLAAVPEARTEARISLDTIRRTVAESRLSREEFQALDDVEEQVEERTA